MSVLESQSVSEELELLVDSLLELNNLLIYCFVLESESETCPLSNCDKNRLWQLWQQLIDLVQSKKNRPTCVCTETLKWSRADLV